MSARSMLHRSALALFLAAAPVVPAGAAALAPDAAGDDPGTGTLLARVAGRPVPLPLTAMNAEIRVSGVMVRTDVEQRFRNPLDRALDADYAFPLPEGAAVDAMALEVGDRSFRGEIREREEARRIFSAARDAGKSAAVVEQHRPNLFRTGVANIPPHAEVVVRLSLLDEADWSDGAFETVLPLTITPRYAPPSFQEERLSCDATSADSGVAVRIRAAIEVGVDISDVSSPSHAILTTVSGGTTSVRLAGDRAPADRDFVLRWRPRVSDSSVLGAVVEQGQDESYAMAMLVPPALDRPGARGFPTQTVFVVDVSGSMAGPSIEQAKAALLEALERLGASDTFTLIKFDSSNEAFSKSFLPADPGSVASAKRWVESLSPGSGTEILPALVRALTLSEAGDSSMLKRVVLITDGAVENEEETLRVTAAHLGGTRLHVVGIGPAPNRWLMRELARAGRGTFESIGNREQVASKISDLLTRTERAAITDVALEWGGTTPADVDPDPVPDLYSGRPLVVTMRLEKGVSAGELRLWGRTPGGPVVMDARFRPVPMGSGIATRWARRRVAGLEASRMRGADPETVRAEVIGLAERFSLVTPYTSFVVVADEAISEDPDALEGDAPGELPSGGTLDPMFLALGLGLCAGGTVLLLAARYAGSRR